MKTRECQVLLSVALEKTRVTADTKTVLGMTGTEEREMARAYLADGMTFFSSHDPVNALASYYYAFGWLHFGNCNGTLVTDMQTPPCPFTGIMERLPMDALLKLSEKVSRYERLLNTARSSVSCAPDPSTHQYNLAGRVLQVAESYAIRGRWLVQENRPEDALAAFSYGHGWLDAGVRAGLFCITQEREIFTV